MGGWTELHVAAEAGDLARVRQAVQRSPADIDKRTAKEKQTALHLAAAGGWETVVNELLDRQARTALQDAAGRTPMHLAVAHGHVHIVAALLGPRNKENPADRQAQLLLRDGGGLDPLAAAVAAGHGRAAEALLRAGADAGRSTDAAGSGLLLLAVRRGHVHLLPLLTAPPARLPLEQRNPATGGTPLHEAAEAGALPAVQWLLAAGASVTTRDNRGRTPAEAALAAEQVTVARAIREAAAAGATSRPGSATASGGGGGSGGGYGLYGGVAAPPAGAGQEGAGGQDPAQVQLQAQGQQGLKLQIPDQPPPTVYYPNLPPGAGVFY